MRIASVAKAVPPYRYTQDQIRARLESLWAAKRSVVSRLQPLHDNTLVRSRNLALPLEEYGVHNKFGVMNDHWIRVAQDVGQEALQKALDQVQLKPTDIDAIFSVTVTGVCSPSLDARLANRMGFRDDIKRTPIFGLGCVAGAAGISRAIDYVRAFPDQIAVLVSVELSSLTFQVDDTSVANLISVGLFGDGAAAVVIVGEERAQKMGLRGLRVVDTKSVFYPNTEDLMGWRVSERGFDIILSPEVPKVAQERIAPGVDALLSARGKSRADVSSWVCHPGGPKVLAAMRDGLGLTDADVQFAWRSLAEQGNLSSSSVLMVLHDTIEEAPRAAGELGMLLAMGPAFCSEVVLFEW